MRLKIMRNKKYVIAFLIIISLTVTAFMSANIVFSNAEGIKIEFKVDKSFAFSLRISDYELYTQITAVDPLNPNVSVTILNGFVNNSELYLNPTKNVKFKEVLDDWADRLGQAEFSTYFETYLLVSIWLISRDKDYRVMPDTAINFNPFKVRKNLVREVIVVKPNELREIPKNTTVQLSKLATSFSIKQIGGYFTTYEWVINSTLSRTYHNFVKVPIMLLDNPEALSAQVDGEIEIRTTHSTRFRLSIGYGYKILENQYASLNIYSLRAGYKDVLQYKNGYPVGPATTSKGWIYINATPTLTFEEEYQYLWWRDYSGQVHLISASKTGNERIKVEITDIQWVIKNNIKRIVGGFNKGFPETSFMDQFFYGTETEPPPISDYTIDPSTSSTENSIYLDEIIKGYDSSTNAIGVGLPVGALIASQISATSSLAPLIPIIAPIVVSVGYEEGITTRIDGYVENRALVYSDDSDVSEKVYVAVSDYAYKVSTHSLKIPSGIYFDFITDTTNGGGCPYLFTYTKNGFVNEGLLSIHNSDGLDVVFSKTLSATPSKVDGMHIFRLVEHNFTYSYINSVKLFAVIANGSIVELPLVYAHHSAYGDVLNYLIKSDNLHIVIVGSNFRNWEGSHYIDLKFKSLNEMLNIASFIFQIEGHNVLIKT